MGIAQDLRRGRRVRQRKKKLPTLFVPITRGPIENFYHFIMGYFVPLFWERAQRPGEPITAMSVPAYNRWFELLPGPPVKLLDQSQAMKHAFLSDSDGFGQHYRVQGLMYWDKWERFPNKPLKEIATLLHESLEGQLSETNESSPEILLISRKHISQSESFENSRPSGALKRNIQNIESVAESLQQRYSVELVNPGSISPREMLGKCYHAKAVVGQHGAGLTNAFFLKPGAAMVEIVWPDLLSNSHIDIYGPLCDQLGIRWSRPVLQSHAFSKVEESQVLHELSLLVD